MAPQVLEHPGTRTTRRHLMATQKSSAPHAHPSTDDHDDTVEAHYACLERACACNDGWVTIGQLALDPETGEETEEFALYLCRKCAGAGRQGTFRRTARPV
jgi:hypothetical protein